MWNILTRTPSGKRTPFFTRAQEERPYIYTYIQIHMKIFIRAVFWGEKNVLIQEMRYSLIAFVTRIGKKKKKS